MRRDQGEGGSNGKVEGMGANDDVREERRVEGGSERGRDGASRRGRKQGNKGGRDQAT